MRSPHDRIPFHEDRGRRDEGDRRDDERHRQGDRPPNGTPPAGRLAPAQHEVGGRQVAGEPDGAGRGGKPGRQAPGCGGEAREQTLQRQEAEQQSTEAAVQEPRARRD